MILEELAGLRSQRSKIRIEFYELVAKKARMIAEELISNQDWVGKSDDDRPSRVHHELERAHLEDRSNPLNGLLHAAENLMENLQKCQDANNIDSLLVVVFDDASSLMRHGPGDKPHPGLYVALNRIISCLKQLRVWSFFLSTESLIGHLVPPNNATRTGNYHQDMSARLSTEEANTELERFPPFDPILRKTELLKPLKTFVEPKYMALFGRPLWYAYGDQLEHMAKVARLKHIGGQQGGSYNPRNPDHVLAALSFRLSLDVCLQNPRTLSHKDCCECFHESGYVHEPRDGNARHSDAIRANFSQGSNGASLQQVGQLEKEH
ncbi:uncharacterized protein Z518_01240 [Rhinocladiella mackenziei CBS 650.93]|uniref:Uncharacterized protein n=1 Tax=Rhinocladiella mackenziei CBS 650.93 TaxID=1442369 RepID=A0A0D2IVU0_9EURO|nr:uncharacterized protein Z518_01240 [Rhinocladiella mackenziei CBS 650.93]KIX10159.1 hypothetical protein Z518_01240 [Rhinocladiella mackenziei CBS 650.93]